MMTNNNNLDNEIGLVTEFLNIWSDFEKFSNRKEMCKSQVIGSLTESTDVRFSKRLKCLDSRDLGENLYIDYVGSYTVKKSTKEGSSRYRQPRQKRREEASPSKKLRGIPNLNTEEIPVLNTEESNVKYEDLVNNFPLCESKIVSEYEEIDKESKDEVNIDKQTKSLLDFLKQHKILDAEEVDIKPPLNDISVPHSNEASLLDINANEIEAPPEANDDIEDLPFHVDDNNNPVTDYPVIIDITGSDTDSYPSNVGYDDGLEVSGDFDDIFESIDYKHPLEFSWTFWYFTLNPGKSWRDNLEMLTTVSTVEDFWSVINWISSPSEMKIGADFSMFKEGIYPDWSDVHNEEGGRYVVKFNKDEIDEHWIEMLMSLIGQHVAEEEHMDKVNSLCFTEKQSLLSYNI